jgi:Ca2+-binding EF-hand superfamily protein
VKELFEKVDLNHDGTLTVAEISECLKKYPVAEIQELVK